MVSPRINQLCEISYNPQISVAYNHKSLLLSLMMKGSPIWNKPLDGPSLWQKEKNKRAGRNREQL